MYLQMLPEVCVTLLDAMSSRTTERLEAALELFQQERQEFLAWIDLHGALASGIQEQAGFENLRLVWFELEEMLRTSDLFGSLDKMYQVYGLRAEIQRERWRRGFGCEEVVNGALLDAEKVICKGLSSCLLSNWNQPLQDYFRGCWERALEGGRLPLEERGFRAFQRGLDLWIQGPSTAELEECMRWLAWGSNQIESFLRALPPGFLAWELQGSPSPEQLDQIYCGFLQAWERLVLSASRRSQLLDELEDVLCQLEAAAQPAQLSALQAQLAELWEGSRQEALLTRPEGLSESLLFEALQGHLEGHVPGLVLQRMGQDFLGSPKIRRELFLYLQTGELENLERLAELLLSPVEVAPFSLALVA